jgi:nucleotide-binding universal stress UspA family protein
LINDVIRRYVSQELDVHPMVECGDAAHQIARIAEKNKVDLIIMSTREKTGWRRLVNGSTVEKVVRLSPCSVLAIQVSSEGHELHSED